MAVDIRISPTAFNYADAWVKGVTAGQNQARLDLDWAKWINTVEQQDKVEAAVAKATAERDKAGAAASAAALSGTVRGDGKPANNTAVWSGLSTEQRALLDSIAQGESAGSYTKLYGGRDFAGFADHPRVAVPVAGRPGLTSSAAGRYQFLGSTWDTASRALGLKDFSPESQDRAALWLAQRDYARNSGGRSLDDDLRAGAFNPRFIATTWTSLPGGREGARATGIKAEQWASRYNANLLRARGGVAGISPEQGPAAPTPEQIAAGPAAERKRVQSQPVAQPLVAVVPVQPQGAGPVPSIVPVAPLDTQPGAGLGLPSIGAPLPFNPAAVDNSTQRLLETTPFGTYADPATLDAFRSRRSDASGLFLQPTDMAAADPFDPNQFFPVA
jgi:muramidase (phage lysozyme)